MTIRLQNLLVIPPIFLILGLAVGLLADRAAREEIVWGLEEESVALAVTVAEMTGGAVLDRILSGDSATAATVRRDLARIGRYGQAESIILYSRVQDGSVVALHRDTTAAALEQALWEEQVREVNSHRVLGEVAPWGPYPHTLAAAAPIYMDGAGTEPRGAVAVVIDATRMDTVTRELRRDFILLVILVTGLGVAAALFLSVSLGRQVRELREMGATVAAGEYRVPVQVSGVKEVQDLSNTLGTMASILSDVLTRGRRALLVGDPFQLAQGMATAYRAERLTPAPVPPGVDVGVSAIGRVPSGCFHGWTEVEGRTVFWAGVVAPGLSLDVAVEAAAVNRAMACAMKGGSPEEVAGSVSSLFHLDTFQVAWFEGPAEGSPEARVLVGTGAPVRKGDYCVIHSFQSDEMDSLAGSLSLFKDLPAEQASREIPLALPEDFAGVLLLIRPSSATA